MSAPQASSPIITLLTDFGLDDGTVGVMKGVILGLAPQARLVDLSHAIGPQDVRAAAFVLGRTAPYFPEGTIHLVVVDPGVGTLRRPMGARLGLHYFVSPDTSRYQVDQAPIASARRRRSSSLIGGSAGCPR
jgi:S-adenosylmethionine hydrolase